MKWKFSLLGLSLAVFLSGCGGGGENENTSGNAEGSQTGGGSAEGTEDTGEEGNNNQETVSINFATPDPENASITVAANEFADRVEEKSDGSIEVEVHGDGSLYGGDPSAAINQLGEGSLDMLALSSTVYANSESKFNAISIPYLYDDKDQYIDLLNDDLGQQLLENIKDSGINGLNYWPRNFRQITNSVNPINEPSDLEGLKLRVPNNPLWVDFFEAAGANPTPMDFGEVYNALQLGTIDGQENPVEIPVNANFYEVQDYISMTNHMADAWVVGINSEVFNEISSEQQDIIQNTADEMQQWLREYDTDQTEEMIQTLKDQGMEVNEVSDENQQKFVEISQSQYSSFRDVVGDDEYFNKVLEFVGKAQ
ncbi:DctP family TRAP transporter solute-binding subunit [Salibacterium halotolerans]|uniref:Tripartite ATP-independent transporter solute receptor, DctP family n=1 Tax=Salibacterium halotolerans TaxID=1884432 RepID=A0A1I5LAF1_9BACI|nr:DctP family TRAP transporter solute-binding subunit [Salibacterium halotolerans]SFO94173.1 tripartite ATP-independent transporter solute receptor, DctP family [Salibacterium halotolerans]